MKKMSKRFFTLVMALVMALSCTVVASAAEVDSVGYVANAYSDESGIMPLGEHTFKTEDRSNLSDGQVVSGSFTYPGPGDTGSLVMACRVDGSVRVKITAKFSLFPKTLYDGNITNGTDTASWYNIPEGAKISYTITSNGNTNRVVLILSGYTDA